MSKFKSNYKRVKANIRRIEKIDATKAMSLGAVEVTGLISDRADKGRGLDGSFSGYSDGYLKKRKKKGRTTRPNLQFSGELIRSLLKSFKVSKEGIKTVSVVSVPNRDHTKSKSSMVDIVDGLSKKRPFFGLTVNERKKVRKVIINELCRTYAKFRFR